MSVYMRTAPRSFDSSALDVRNLSAAGSGRPPLKVRLKIAPNATAAERAKLNEAAALLQIALNSPELESALKARFGAEKGGRIYQRLRSGAEVLSPRADREADLNVGFFDPRSRSSWRRKLAVSSSNRSLIQLNRAAFADRDPARVARTLGHMLAYKLGYGGAVPEVLGTLAQRLARTNPSPAPAPGPAPAPAPGPVSPQRPRNPVEFISAFHQGKEGNCVSIAAIKAAMARFGPDAVFKSVERVSGGHQVVMRDGFKVRVSDAELRTATGVSRMKGRDQALLAKANLIYAAMAKRAQLEGNDGRRNLSYAGACETLNNGENYKEGAKWLGIERYVKVIPPSQMDRYDAVVAASSRHAVFSTGRYVDHYGTKKPNARGGAMVEGWGRRILGAYALV